MKNRLFTKLLIAAALFLPVSAGFVYFSQEANKFVDEKYITTSFAEVAQLRASMENEWNQLDRLVDVWSVSPLIAPTRRLDTISAAIEGIANSSILIRNVSVVGSKDRLIASTSEEFLLYGSQNKGLHPGLRAWPLTEAFEGRRSLAIGEGSYESYYLVPITDQAGSHHGVLAIELTLTPFTDLASGFLGRWNLGVGLRSGDLHLVSDPQVPKDHNGDLSWVGDNKLLVSVPLSNNFLGQSDSARLTVARNWRPVRQLQNRITVFTFGLSSIAACIFFFGVVFVGGRFKPVDAPAVQSDIDVRIRTSDHGEEGPALDVAVNNDRKAS